MRRAIFRGLFVLASAVWCMLWCSLPLALASTPQSPLSDAALQQLSRDLKLGDCNRLITLCRQKRVSTGGGHGVVVFVKVGQRLTSKLEKLRDWNHRCNNSVTGTAGWPHDVYTCTSTCMYMYVAQASQLFRGAMLSLSRLLL